MWIYVLLLFLDHVLCTKYLTVKRLELFNIHFNCKTRSGVQSTTCIAIPSKTCDGLVTAKLATLHCACALINKPDTFTRRVVMCLGEWSAAPLGTSKWFQINKDVEVAGDRQSVGRSPAILSLIHDHRQSDLSLPRCLAVMGKPTVLLKATGHSTLKVTGRYKDSHCRCKLPEENSIFFFIGFNILSHFIVAVSLPHMLL